MRASVRLAAALLIAVGVAGGGPARAAEQRCHDLGPNCVCSEPFADTQRSVSGFEQNPGDSTTKECAGGKTLTNATPRPVSAAGLGLPSAASIDTVWEDDGVHGGAVEGNTPERPGSKRICVRYYVRYSSSYEFFGDGDCRAGKLTQIDLGSKISSSPLHAEAKRDQWRIITQGLGGSTMRASGEPKPEDCRGDWCRIEMCLSGDIDQGKSLYARKCSICHGKDGVAKKMVTGSANLNDPEWQEATSLEDIATVISEGRNKMLPYKTKLTPTQIQQIAQYVKTLK